MKIIGAFLIAMLVAFAPARALTVQQVVEASDLIAKVKALKADLDSVGKMKGDDVQARVTEAPPVITCPSTSLCGVTYYGTVTCCSDNATYVTLPKDIVRRAIQKRIDDVMDRLNELGIKP